MNLDDGQVAALVMQWQQEHGRSHLPWQQSRDPYRVWLSEIMLQQTQVRTVLDYFPRFLERFSDVRALAAASQDEVLSMWSGLGYYSRARNLHRCAQQVVAVHGGVFPTSAVELAALPGIGRSTAGAIAAFCFGERAPILDANVRRVLTRLLGFGEDLAIAAHERTLWELATSLLPHQILAQAMPRYTQGLMDLGAMVCVPRKPLCGQCPLQAKCCALAQGAQEAYPVRTRKLVRSSEAWWLLVLRDSQDRVWLQRRESRGIWAGLYCVPVFHCYQDLVEHPLGRIASNRMERASFLHVLTHRDLHLHPVLGQAPASVVVSDDEGAWFGAQEWRQLGLPAPVRKLLDDTTLAATGSAPV